MKKYTTFLQAVKNCHLKYSDCFKFDYTNDVHKPEGRDDEITGLKTDYLSLKSEISNARYRIF